MNTPTSPSLLPDNWNEFIKDEALKLFPVIMENHRRHPYDANETDRNSCIE
jgi:hypothetical protein